MGIREIHGALLTAAGISDKALGYLEEDDKIEAITDLINTLLDPVGADFVEELVYKFLLTRGDTLGGSMRNVGGALAQRKLTRSLISCLNLAGTEYWWTDKRKRLGTKTDHLSIMHIEITLRGLA